MMKRFKRLQMCCLGRVVLYIVAAELGAGKFVCV